MDNTAPHRELLLPTPSKEAPTVPPLVWTSPSTFWLEILREAAGRVRYSLGSDSATDLEALAVALENGRPRLALGRPVECPIATGLHLGMFARAVPRLRHHHLPLLVRPESDNAGYLLRTLSSSAFRDHDVVLQLLFRRVKGWESTLVSPLYDSVSRKQDFQTKGAMWTRLTEPAYHVELRVGLRGPRPKEALTALGTWLEQWTVAGGAPWRTWKVIPAKKEWKFLQTFATHDMRRFTSRKARRDVSATELAHLLSIPWAAHHPECSYAGAPIGQARPDLVLRPSDPEPTQGSLVVGTHGARRVTLPHDWHHLAILGRTQSGKSTLALNLVLQILNANPSATVVVIEPTGTLVDGVVSRLPRQVAEDTVEIDPAHATFHQDDETMVSVPFGLLRPPECTEGGSASADRWSEALAGDLLAAIRSAWGEESIGGRAELVLRALVQGLSLTPGSNLVDAYQILSSKQALQRFVKTAPPGPLRDFLEHHLPRLDYNFTMSSLDKVGKIATNPLLRVALCQRSHAVSFDRLLQHQLLLLNLSKAAVGADGANFLGAIYLTQLWAAVQRSGRPDRPVYLILDEVHNYAVPALADMLSEGAKFGLHVVAVTQYLHRVPARVRAALLGNVDAWLLFSLGTEDMDEAWKIVNGTLHGWHPQDLVDGLRPHEVAMATSGDLVKLGTLASPVLDPLSSDLRALATQSSRRYAQPEDSEASPWLVGQEEAEGSLRSLSSGPRSRAELADDAELPPDRLEAALALAAALGDIERGGNGLLRLTPRGEVHLRVLEARRNEGEEHVETLTEFAMFLAGRGIALTVPQQIAGVLTPDGQFRWGGSTYNVEVECSTVTKAADQVVRNVKKGRDAGYRVLIVLPDRARVPQTLRVLKDAFPDLRIWTDGVGVVWKEGRATFRAHRVPGSKPWSFLEPGGSADSVSEDTTVDDGPTVASDTDPLVAHLRRTVQDWVSAGKTEATSSDVLSSLPSSERSQYSDERIGRALKFLGIDSRRVKANGTRYRIYEIIRKDPVSGSGSETGPSAAESSSSNRARGFSSENN
jgi:hypothetical protein